MVCDNNNRHEELYMKDKKGKETKFIGTQDSSVIYYNLYRPSMLKMKQDVVTLYVYYINYLIQCHQ